MVVTPVPPSPARQRLQRQRRLALILLTLAIMGFVAASLGQYQGGWAWLGAFSEAAMVGALADWFAVVALFRRPLGLPFPHTAILPRNRDRLALRLAEFIRTHFLQEAALVTLIQRQSPSAALGHWLDRPRNRSLLSQQALKFLRHAVLLTDLEPLRQHLARALAQRLQDVDIAYWLGKLLQLLTEDDRHQALLNDGIGRLRDWLDREETRDSLARSIEDMLQRAYPTLFTWLGAVVDPTNLSHNLARNLVRAVHEMLQEISDDPEHPKRQAFDNWLRQQLLRLRDDQSLQDRLRRWQGEIMEHPAARVYLQTVLADLRQWLLTDLEAPDSRLRRAVMAMSGGLGRLLHEEPQLRAMVDGFLADSVRRLAPTVQDRLSEHIAETIRTWPMAQMIQVLEDGIGSDLQFIRMNGTVVGGILGLLIHSAGLLLALI